MKVSLQSGVVIRYCFGLDLIRTNLLVLKPNYANRIEDSGESG